jgi:hypothetical protein
MGESLVIWAVEKVDQTFDTTSRNQHYSFQVASVLIGDC